MTTTPRIDDLIEDDVDVTPQTLLTDLAQLHLRAIAPPTPRYPAAMGWQMQAAALAGLSTRLLHALLAAAPQAAAELAEWYAGPFGDGPDLIDGVEWLDDHVARPAGADIEAWILEGRRAAEKAAARVADRDDDSDAVHRYFSLSYANYLVLPRTLMQSMPGEWQAQFVHLLKQLDETFEGAPQAEAYIVQAAVEKPAYDLDVQERQAARVSVNSDQDDTMYTHRSLVGETTEVGPDDLVLVPVADPVPHYNRGRTRVTPGGRSL
ncbi:hypothetical protein [Streptomyces sp. DH12]|uniref:hypothetical protein n=1 Tax=Streptomyces sp. DH12 TaxID=2857010 RepID=UPI001E3334E1|nr:hypothetical protein [Streptomyces sp. DH12]